MGSFLKEGVLALRALSGLTSVSELINTMQCLYLVNENLFRLYTMCSDKSYYTGITNDIDRRLCEHQQGLNTSCYTYKRRPLQLVFCEVFHDVNQAIAFEKQVKGWRRAKKEAIINGNWDLLPELAKTAKL